MSELNKSIEVQTPYNYSHVSNNISMNCSEFVHNAFYKIERKVGHFQSIQDQNIHSLNNKIYNIIKYNNKNISDKNSKVISPVSIVHTPSLTVINSTLEHDNFLSDRAIIEAWKLRGLMERVRFPIKYSETNIITIEDIQAASQTPFSSYQVRRLIK